MTKNGAEMSVGSDEELWREPRVLEVCGLRRSTMRQYVAAGRFPAPVKIGERASAWVSGEVRDWVRQRIEQSRAAARVA